MERNAHRASRCVVGPLQQDHAVCYLTRPVVPVAHQHCVALVAHHPPYLQAGIAGQFGQGPGVAGGAAAARHADIDVDQDLVQSGSLGGVDRSRRVHRNRHPGAGYHQDAQARSVEHLVGHDRSENGVRVDYGPGPVKPGWSPAFGAELP